MEAKRDHMHKNMVRHHGGYRRRAAQRASSSFREGRLKGKAH